MAKIPQNNNEHCCTSVFPSLRPLACGDTRASSNLTFLSSSADMASASLTIGSIWITSSCRIRSSTEKIWLLHIHVFCLIEANSWLQFTMTRSQGQNFYQSQGQDYNLMLWLLLLWKMNLTETEIFFNELDKWKNIFFTFLKLRVMVIILTILHLYSHLVFSIMINYLLCLCS